MAKRFTDTDKWKKTLLKSMPSEYKLLWLYICDDCDHAGIWHVDIQIASLRIGEDVFVGKWIAKKNYWGDVGWHDSNYCHELWYSRSPEHPTHWQPLPEFTND